jgi:hypothetical protein
MNPTLTNRSEMVKMNVLPNPKAMITSFTTPETIGFSCKKAGFLIFLLAVVVQVHTIVNSISMIPQPSRNEFEINMEDMKSEESVASSRSDSKELKIELKPRSNPKFIFGHSTGHAGSTALHYALSEKGCPWDTVEKFENNAPGELKWDHDTDKLDHDEYQNMLRSKSIESSLSCGFARTKIIPYLRKYKRLAVEERNISMENTTFLDLGHFHNRGRTLECLADELKDEVTFIRVRRNRYDIAKSFIGQGNKFTSPCKSPVVVGLCPKSGQHLGAVNLQVADEIWNRMTPFQRFLWYADEMEHRWHTLIAVFHEPTYHEITWSNSTDLERETVKVRRALGCSSTEIKNKHQHIAHKIGTINCTDLIQQDYEYRDLMKYDEETIKILYPSQGWASSNHMRFEECLETKDELDGVVRRQETTRSTW